MPKTDITKECKIKIVCGSISYYLEIFHIENYIGAVYSTGIVNLRPCYEFQGEHFGNFRIFKKG